MKNLLDFYKKKNYIEHVNKIKVKKEAKMSDNEKKSGTYESLSRAAFLDALAPDEKPALQDVLLAAGTPSLNQSPQDIMQAPFGNPEPDTLPYNKATMECERGPCIHMWNWMQQNYAIRGDLIQIQHTAGCLRHQEMQSLADDRVFNCNQWFPEYLSFIPVSLRSLLRPSLKKLYREILELFGYDFSWQWFPLNFFELPTETRFKIKDAALKAKKEHKNV